MGSDAERLVPLPPASALSSGGQVRGRRLRPGLHLCRLAAPTPAKLPEHLVWACQDWKTDLLESASSTSARSDSCSAVVWVLRVKGSALTEGAGPVRKWDTGRGLVGGSEVTGPAL